MATGFLLTVDQVANGGGFEALLVDSGEGLRAVQPSSLEFAWPLQRR